MDGEDFEMENMGDVGEDVSEFTETGGTSGGAEASGFVADPALLAAELRNENLMDHAERTFGVKIPREYVKDFRQDEEGNLRYNDTIISTKIGGGRILADSTLKKNGLNASQVRELRRILSIAEVPSIAPVAGRDMSSIIDVETQKWLGESVDKVDGSLRQRVWNEANLDEQFDAITELLQRYEELEAKLRILGDPDSFTVREFTKLDENMRTYRGELKIQQSRLLNLDRKAADIKERLEGETTSADADRLTRELAETNEQREGVLAAIDSLKGSLKPQLAAIKDLVLDTASSDLSLREKLSNIFKEQGVTIVSILTALGSIIAAIVASVMSVAGSGNGGGKGGGGGKSPGGIRGFVKDKLSALGKLLVELGKKAAAALPGVIGSVVGMLFKGAGEIVKYVANNLWLLMAAVGAVAFNYLAKGEVRKKVHSKK